MKSEIKVFEKRRKKEFTARICRCLHTKGTHKEGIFGGAGKCFECICNKFVFLNDYTILELEQLQKENFQASKPISEFKAYVQDREVKPNHPLPIKQKPLPPLQKQTNPIDNLNQISKVRKFYSEVTIDMQVKPQKETRRCLKCGVIVPNINAALEGHLLSKRHLEASKK